MTWPYIPEPLLPGGNYPGGGTNAAIDRFNELRAKIVEMQTTLGVNPQGSRLSIAERLLTRHARSGVRRGIPSIAGASSAGTAVGRDYADDVADNIEVNAFIGECILGTAPQATVYYGTQATPAVYTVAPSIVMVQPTISQSVDIVNNGVFFRMVTVDSASIGVSSVTVNLVERQGP